MNVSVSQHDSVAERRFRFFKYTVYLLLVINIALFFREEWLASAHVFAGGVAAGHVIEAFAATIDTATWVVLLLLFELETSVLPDERIRGRTRLVLHGARLLCYAMVLYAFYGYLVKALGFSMYEPANVASLCDLVKGQFSMMVDLDEFNEITDANCKQPANAGIVMLPGTAIYATGAQYLAALRLAWVDVVNSAAWILVLAVLEVDVRLQLAGRLEGLVLLISKGIKAVLYTTLVVCAAYWGVAGDFLDFWDAFLWILAFVAIEMNMFKWQADTREVETEYAAA